MWRGHCCPRNGLHPCPLELKFDQGTASEVANLKEQMTEGQQPTTSCYPIVSTARNFTFPLIMCAYASAAFSSGNFSIIGRTPVSALKFNVSCESIAVPEGQP